MRQLIKARNIRRSFGSLQVLKGIDLDIESSKVTTIVGPSGAGKTTLLQILGSLMPCDSGGSVIFDGTDLSKLPDAALSRFRNRNIGFVFQQHRLLPEFTIEENVALPALIAGNSKAIAIARAGELLQRLGLYNRRTHRPAELSGGECQRAAVARALVNSPGAVLADEPSGSLDLANRRTLHDLFFELRDSTGTSFIIVTHDESLAEHSDTIIHMADGLISSIRHPIQK